MKCSASAQVATRPTDRRMLELLLLLVLDFCSTEFDGYDEDETVRVRAQRSAAQHDVTMLAVCLQQQQQCACSRGCNWA